MTVKKGGGDSSLVAWGAHLLDVERRRKKGGGRESGDAGEPVSRTVAGPNPSPNAAANPAAEPHKFGLSWTADVNELQFRNRELRERAEKAEFRMYEAEARVKELEAEHAECPRPRPEREDG